ncbi:DUF1217 domain-containing protein [Parasedimentitalea psychrophila]|uniref:DUF1217 domain-containing protein n=1 Tax=Parasedimentitalea psychrophila TaxID=2997337 RepID=A0A9Y2P5U8_9RHOB|nr:DUF1217 domain-containing protein [Parasedimentitalea psychrophila]WIY26744.1 DUF1217 domain-containing protein [Parasedimentitalea psychrophila]
MSYQPIIPSNGIVGWNFLQATYDKQFETFTKDAVLQRETDYFVENIGNVKSAEDLMADPRLLSVALDAFGLGEDIYKKAYLEKILTDGTAADDALANKLGDDRYVQFSDAFGFGPGDTIKTGSAQEMADLVFTNKVQSFEEAVGEQEASMRIALYGQRELVNLAEDGTSTDTQWFNIMGQSALREMFEVALGLPESLSQIDLDQQLEAFKSRAESIFGTDNVSDFSDPDLMDKLVNTYLAREQLKDFDASQSSGATALMLLQS